MIRVEGLCVEQASCESEVERMPVTPMVSPFAGTRFHLNAVTLAPSLLMLPALLPRDPPKAYLRTAQEPAQRFVARIFHIVIIKPPKRHAKERVNRVISSH